MAGLGLWNSLLICAALAVPLAGAPEAQTLAGGVPHVTIDASQTGHPISPYIYGQFLEHGGNIVNEGVWAEMLEDRKFYYPVTSKPLEETRSGNWASGRRRPPLRRWMPIGGDEFITMDTTAPFAGEHTPRVELNETEPHGFAQSGVAVRKGMAYVGQVCMKGDPGAEVKVSLVWGEGPGDRQTATLPHSGAAYRSLPLHFVSGADSEEARLEITATGRGAIHVGAVTLMPANNIEGFRAEVIGALKQLHSGVYRFPGGNFVSAYEWRDAVGERDRRPPTFDPVWGAVQPNDLGTDEFMTLCRLLGVDPYITVNAGFGDAWSARQLVEYTNGAVTTPMGTWRAANGHPAPYGVKLWGIGNEPWGDYQMGAMAPQQFALKHVQFAKAMRKMDPSITLIAGGAMPDVMVGAKDADLCGAESVGLRAEHGAFDHVGQAGEQGHLLADGTPCAGCLQYGGQPSEVEVTEKPLGALPKTLTVPPFSVNLYAYPVQ